MTVDRLFTYKPNQGVNAGGDELVEDVGDETLDNENGIRTHKSPIDHGIKLLGIDHVASERGDNSVP